MNVKTWIPLVAAVMLGLIALVVARKALSKGGGGDAKADQTTIVVAAHDLPPNHVLKAEDLTTRKVPAETVVGGSFRSPKDADGRIVMHAVKKDELVIEPLLVPAGGVGGLSTYVGKGLRAMTLEVNEFTGVAGMITPGAKVDVISVLRDKKTDQPLAKTILADVLVRAVGRNITGQPNPDGTQPPPSNNVTLLLTPRQAQILQLASQGGRPWLVLRGSQETEQVPETEATTLAELRGDAADGAAGRGPVATVSDPATTRPGDAGTPATEDPFGQPRPVATARVVQIIRGGVESTVTFPATPEPRPTPATVRPAAPAEPRKVLTGGSSEAQKPE